jgi:hypothetical protein
VVLVVVVVVVVVVSMQMPPKHVHPTIGQHTVP